MSITVSTVRGATYQTVLPASLTLALHELSRQQGVSLDVTLTAAWLTLLYRYSSQEDLLIGIVAAAHRQEQTQALIGPSENTLVLRMNLSGQPSFVELLERVRKGMMAAQAHADVPFEAQLKALSPTRLWSLHPLFSVLLRLPWEEPGLPAGRRLAKMEAGESSTLTDLTLDLHDGPQGLTACFTYLLELFDEATIRRMAGHWQTLLEGIVADPALPLTRLPLLTAQERKQLVVEWNATQGSYPALNATAGKCVHQLFEAQVERNPSAVAVVSQGEQISYQELNQQANLLARHLRAHGVGSETLVAMLTERNIPFVIAILAIFKAGGAYLPLDPHYPEARLRRVIEQSQCKLVLTSTDFATTLSRALEEVPREVRPHCINLQDVQYTSESVENLPATNTPENLAYVIYTSGSTGLPKGAMIEQRGMLNHLYAKIEALNLTAADTVAQTASQCFDISVWQFLAVLLVGGRVQIYPDVVAHDATRLLQQVEQHHVSILETVPSLLRAMLDAQESEASDRPKLEGLRWLIPTGEALPVDLCRRWLRRYPHVPLLNAYGPTECSDDVTHYVISQEPEQGRRSIPIGRAIPNMRLYVLDRQLEPLPIGVSGELYVGGIGVGRGYLGDEQRTKGAFVPDPFVPEGGARLYKTGDIARYLPDGNLEFLGRVDSQVKLRGLRIELGEIEAVLNQHPAVREAVVVVREEEPGKQRLVAYVVLHQGQGTLAEELKSQMRKQVPSYMVPSSFVQLDKLPLTANGKLDRKALPAPEPDRRKTEESYVAPVLPLHHQLVQIWEEVLGVHPVGIKDDFFELGGDSLLAVKLFEHITQVYGKRLALSTLFAGATIEQVAGALGEETQTKELAPLVVVQAGGSRRPFFFLHGEWRGGALYTRELARSLGPEQPFYLLEPYQLDGQAVPPTFEEMATAHLATLRRVQPEGPYLLGGYCNGGLMAYEMARQLHAQGQRVDLLLLIDPDAPARHRWVRMAVSHLCDLMGIDQEKQLAYFLSLQHLYRYLRFSHYRRSKIAELLGVVKPGEARHKLGNEDIAAPLRLKLKAFFPHVETLRQEYLNLYDWSATDYAPELYAGNITFFWTSEEPWRPVGWQKVVQAKKHEVEIYTLPGNHITSRTEHLPIMAEHLRTCLNRAQTSILD